MTTTQTQTLAKCFDCNGSGKSYDPTCADKVFAGPFADQCASCAGKGVKYVVSLSPTLASYERGIAGRLAAVRADDGDIPDWMC